jgi:adenylate cyclase class IV
MPDELELKAVIPNPDALRARLLAAGAVERFRGRMRARRYARAGELAARDEVLRVRSLRPIEGQSEALLGWKGPTLRSPDGYKRREEIEIEVAASPHELLTALGYEVVHAVDREVEVFDLDGATVRIERYPAMDPLLEVEGTPKTIERAIRATGIDRAAFTPDSLADFVRRYEGRTGRYAVLVQP